MFSVSACSLALICISGPKTGLKSGPETLPATSADYADRACHAIASLMRTRHSAFCFATRSRHPCGRVTRAIPCRVVASSMRLCHCDFLFFARSRHPCGRVASNCSLPRGPVIHAAGSILAGHLLNFLCSFHFCKLPLQSPTHSCPIKPETLNTQITASNGIKKK